MYGIILPGILNMLYNRNKVINISNNLPTNV